MTIDELQSAYDLGYRAGQSAGIDFIYNELRAALFPKRVTKLIVLDFINEFRAPEPARRRPSQSKR